MAGARFWRVLNAVILLTHTRTHTEAGVDAAVFFFFKVLFIWLHQVLVLVHGLFVAVHVSFSGCGLASRVYRLSCPIACGILVP